LNRGSPVRVVQWAKRFQNRASLPPGWSLAYYAFDLLHLEGQDLKERPLRERRALLPKVLGQIFRRSPSMAYRKVDGQTRNNIALRGAANRMEPRTAWIVNHIVIAGRANTRRHVIQPERLANSPGNYMVGA